MAVHAPSMGARAIESLEVRGGGTMVATPASHCPTAEWQVFRYATLRRAATMVFAGRLAPSSITDIGGNEMPARERSGEHTDRANSGSVGHHDAHLLGVRSLVANKLYDADGNFVGKLEEIVLDVRTGCVRHVIVAMGGVLGLGRRRFAVPWSALQPDAQHCRAVVDVAQMRLTAVPVPNDDPWLRRPAARHVASVGLPRMTRALGAGD